MAVRRTGTVRLEQPEKGLQDGLHSLKHAQLLNLVEVGGEQVG